MGRISRCRDEVVLEKMKVELWEFFFFLLFSFVFIKRSVFSVNVGKVFVSFLVVWFFGFLVIVIEIVSGGESIVLGVGGIGFCLGFFGWRFFEF